MTTYVLVTVWCGDCIAEGQSSPSMLGSLQRSGSGVVRWGVWHRRGTRLPDGSREKIVAMDTIEHPRRPALVPPARLPAFCDRHGHGRVLTGDVLTASGNVVLTLHSHADK